MRIQSEKEYDSYPLLIELGRCFRFPSYWGILIIAIVLLLVLVLAASLDGVLTAILKGGFWRNFLDGPVLTIYILAIYPIIWRLWWRSVKAIQSLLSVNEQNSNRLVLEVPRNNRRWEWMAIIIGAMLWLALWQPWGWGSRWESGAIWLSIYDVITQLILFGLLSLLLYDSFNGSRYIDRLSSQPMKLDIFNTEVLTPIARSSLALSLAFIGGISLSLVFQTQDDLIMWNNILIWVILVGFAIVLFFLSMRSVHIAMFKAKQEKLTLARRHLTIATHNLENRAIDKYRRGNEYSSAIALAAWATYEKQVRETPEWPFDVRIIRRLFASVLVPASVYLLKVLSVLGIHISF